MTEALKEKSAPNIGELTVEVYRLKEENTKTLILNGLYLLEIQKLRKHVNKQIADHVHREVWGE